MPDELLLGPSATELDPRVSPRRSLGTSDAASDETELETSSRVLIEIDDDDDDDDAESSDGASRCRVNG